MRVLITGSAGLLGKALIETAPQDAELFLVYRNVKPETTYQTIQLDLKTPFDLSPYKPDIIIHCASEGDVDKIQQHAYLGVDCILNPTINIIDQVKKIGCRLIYVSTNAVFDGENAPYGDNAPLCPINSYGIFKAACELAVQGSDINWVIARPLLMYGWPNEGQRKNWASIWIDKLKRNESFKVVYDIISQPLYNKDCASVIWKIANTDGRIIYNIAGDDIVSLYDFAREIADVIGADKHLIEPVPSSYFKSLAPRPQNTSYTLENIKNVLSHKSYGVVRGIKEMVAYEYRDIVAIL